MELIIKCFKDDEVILEESLDGRGFYNAILMELAVKYDLISLGDEYFLNNLEALEKRLNYVVPANVISELSGIDLDDDERDIFNIVTVDSYKATDVYEFYQLARRLSIGNLEDITCLLEDNEIDEDSCDYITLEKN